MLRNDDEGARRWGTSMGERECAAEGIGEGGRRERAEVLAMAALHFEKRVDKKWRRGEARRESANGSHCRILKSRSTSTRNAGASEECEGVSWAACRAAGES